MAYEHLGLRGKRSSRLAAHISATKGPDAFGSTEHVANVHNGIRTRSKVDKKAPNARHKSSTPAKSKPTWTDVHLARSQAKAAERKRIEDVMASGATKGKEFMALQFLASDDSAKDIIATLNQLPTDAERAKLRAARKQPDSSGVWDQAIAKSGLGKAESKSGRDDNSLVNSMKARFEGSTYASSSGSGDNSLVESMKARFENAK